LDGHGNERPLVARTQERYAQVQKLRSSGASLNAISRELGLTFRTIRRFANATSVEELLAGALNRSSVLDQFKPYLTRRWNEGCTDGALLHAEIKAQGWAGSLRTIQGYLRPLRGHQTVQVAPLPPPKPRRIVSWIMSHPDHLNPDDKVKLKEVLTRCPELEAAAEHVRSFAAMMTNREGHLLDEWITATAAGDSPHLASFATGLRRDHAAVTNGLTLPYSSGAVEGTVNRIKMIKRKMFGRANFDLLRKLVLLS
jgi:transposase